ncbi:PIG-L family deacetylase, partial [Curtobacterium flaccumfaciens]|uniref:PIG-L family deacetylase n=1 Tax=Curtobacterium flaccumfaciens TaxID=2035 RepID=UPI0026580B19
MVATVLTVLVAPNLAVQPAVAAAADCSAGRVLNVVAHPDDDLLFQGTDLRKDIDAGRCVRSVIVTAGDAGKPDWYWQERQVGLMAAYASMAGVDPASTTGSTTVAGRTLLTETLAADPRISLVFMDLPDGNVEGNGFWANGYESLQRLYTGDMDTLHTVADAPHSATYTLAQLRATLQGIVQDFAPTDIHTLDHEGEYGDGDHSDHHTVAYLTDQVQRQYTGAHGFTGYMGYPIADRPANLTTAQTQAKADAFFTYAAHDSETCASYQACSARPETSWLSRQYTAGSPVPTNPTDPTDPTPTHTDVTGSASVTASAENPADGQTAVKAVDGVVSGYPDAPTAEWVAPSGRAGTWIQLGWAKATALDAVDLADRPNSVDQVLGGTLTFSDGSSVQVPALSNGGAVQRVTFAARSVTWVRFTVTSVSGGTQNVGLAEIRALAPADTTPPPTPTRTDVTGSASVTASAENPADGQTAVKAVDGVVSGYPDAPTAEWVAPSGR